MEAAPLQKKLRQVTLALTIGGVLYLLWRFDAQRLPAEGCSPLYDFLPGDLLLLDRRPQRLGVGDSVLFGTEDGQIYLGRITSTRPADASPTRTESFWAMTQNPSCPGPGSETFGWIERRDCVARILFAWPW